MKHPIQPICKDEKGVLRFKKNAIVLFLLDEGGFDLNMLAKMDFPKEDREQFAQLIGYSLSGFGDLSYTSDETYETARAMAELGITELQARVKFLEEILDEVRDALKIASVAVFKIHPDDLQA